MANVAAALYKSITLSFLSECLLLYIDDVFSTDQNNMVEIEKRYFIGKKRKSPESSHFWPIWK